MSLKRIAEWTMPTRLGRRISRGFTGYGVLSLCFLTTPIPAANIPVENPSFETLPDTGLPFGCGTGCSYSMEVIPGWTNIPFLGKGLTSGQFRPGTDVGNTTYFESLSDGPTSAYTSNGCIVQTVAATVMEGVTYTLVADVGWRRDASPTGVPRLVINDVFYDGVGTPVYAAWAPFTVSRYADHHLPLIRERSGKLRQRPVDDVGVERRRRRDASV
jgi:hypothetical protein